MSEVVNNKKHSEHGSKRRIQTQNETQVCRDNEKGKETCRTGRRRE
jgi:hypothetical protein